MKLFNSRLWRRFFRLMKRIDAAVAVTARVISIVGFFLKVWLLVAPMLGYLS
ncbi:hypothetical protein IVA87_07995 [Bradyrhizobium sp. 147]|uniref:hypothetical protein n=1 Tax=Bradyrhizobium sp. 147 TaxID=2782623 RepID=UPI001FF9C94F|nr:hypothetical protein [Bradyrhizobium sp. 147]MCK1679401.1 hypothetical protein [Bradyrhizobium sp. 147]